MPTLTPAAAFKLGLRARTLIDHAEQMEAAGPVLAAVLTALVDRGDEVLVDVVGQVEQLVTERQHRITDKAQRAEATRRAVLAVACPTCGASPGQRCTRAGSTKLAEELHAARRELAEPTRAVNLAAAADHHGNEE